MTALALGDYVRVVFNSGGRLDGCSIKGEITRIWSKAVDGLDQWQVNKGWCFHPCDEVAKHIPKATPRDEGEEHV